MNVKSSPRSSVPIGCLILLPLLVVLWSCPLEALVEPVAKTQALKVDAKVTCSRLWLKQWPKLKL